MAWSDWPLIVVALLVGAAAGWVVRGRHNAARAGTTEDGTPVAATKTAGGEPTSTSTSTSTSADTDTDTDTDTDRPSGTEPTPVQTATASEPASTQIEPAPAREHSSAPGSSLTEPADADTAAPPVVVPRPVAPDTEPADRSAVAADSGPEPDTATAEPKPDTAASGPVPDATDDFRRIQGVGPKMAAALHAAGIRTYRQLAELDVAALRETIRAAGLRGAASLPTWPQQAKTLAKAPEAAGVPSAEGGANA